MKLIHPRLAKAAIAIALSMLALASFAAHLRPELILLTFAVIC